MNFYETMYIVHPALQAGRLEDILQTVDKKIESLQGKRLYFDNWGKKKLSYAIDKQKYGTYILLQFSMEGSGLQELSSEFEHNANILRYLTNRIDETDLLEQKEDLKVISTETEVKAKESTETEAKAKESTETEVKAEESTESKENDNNESEKTKE